MSDDERLSLDEDLEDKLSEDDEAGGQRGVKGPFTKPQRKHIGVYSKQWLELVKAKTMNDKELTDWRRKVIDKIMASDLFKGKLDPSRTTKQWKMAMRTIFNNDRNYKGRTREGNSTLHDPNKCYEALRLGSRAWAHFTSEVDNGRDLFRRENYNRIREEANESKIQNRGGAFSAALKKLWDQADKDEWNSKARNHVNIEQNRAEFPELLLKTMQCLCQYKRVGDLELLLFFSYRNADGITESYSINASSSEHVPIQESYAAAFKAFQTVWEDFSEECLPATPKAPVPSDDTKSMAITRNSEGIPVFPNVDPYEVPMRSLISLIDMHFKILWARAWPTEDIYPDIPWDEIALNPKKFIDTSLFPFTVSSIDPSSIPPAGIFELVSFLDKNSTKTPAKPFVFLDREEILHKGKTSGSVTSPTDIVNTNALEPAKHSSVTVEDGQTEPMTSDPAGKTLDSVKTPTNHADKEEACKKPSASTEGRVTESTRSERSPGIRDQSPRHSDPPECSPHNASTPDARPQVTSPLENPPISPTPSLPSPAALRSDTGGDVTKAQETHGEMSAGEMDVDEEQAMPTTTAAKSKGKDPPPRRSNRKRVIRTGEDEPQTLSETSAPRRKRPNTTEEKTRAPRRVEANGMKKPNVRKGGKKGIRASPAS